MGEDPYEAALERARARRAEEPATPDQVPKRRPSRNVVARLALGLFLLFVVIRVAGGRAPKPPELARDCARPAFRLSATSVHRNAVVAWTLVGPADRRYALTVDATGVRLDSSGRPRPEPPEALVTRAVRPEGCRASGRLGLAVEGPGEHTVAMWELDADGAGREVARTTVTVAPP